MLEVRTGGKGTARRTKLAPGLMSLAWGVGVRITSLGLGFRV